MKRELVRKLVDRNLGIDTNKAQPEVIVNDKYGRTQARARGSSDQRQVGRSAAGLEEGLTSPPPSNLETKIRRERVGSFHSELDLRIRRMRTALCLGIIHESKRDRCTR